MSYSFGTPWTEAHQAPLSMGCPKGRTLEWIAIFFSKDLPDPGIEPASPTLQVDLLLLSHWGNPN